MAQARQNNAEPQILPKRSLADSAAERVDVPVLQLIKQLPDRDGLFRVDQQANASISAQNRHNSAGEPHRGGTMKQRALVFAAMLALTEMRCRAGLADFLSDLEARRAVSGSGKGAAAALGRAPQARVLLWRSLGGTRS